jgi:hypothetical protein
MARMDTDGLVGRGVGGWEESRVQSLAVPGAGSEGLQTGSWRGASGCALSGLRGLFWDVPGALPQAITSGPRWDIWKSQRELRGAGVALGL